MPDGTAGLAFVETLARAGELDIPTTIEAEAAREFEQPAAKVRPGKALAQLGQVHVCAPRIGGVRRVLESYLGMVPHTIVVRSLAAKHLRSPEVIPKRRHVEE